MSKGLFLVIHNKAQDKYYNPVLKSGVTIDWQWKGAPGKATFSCYKAAPLDFHEGDEVFIKWDNTKVFKGFVFTKQRDREGWINVTAYDQLRYLKNKAVYTFVDKTASDIIKAIAEDFQLHVGDICATNYVIPKYRGSNQALMDIIQDVLDMTTENETASTPAPKATPTDDADEDDDDEDEDEDEVETQADEDEDDEGEDDAGGNETPADNRTLRLFCLYDDFGALTVKPLDEMRVPLLVDAATAGNFSYESTIDKETYNKVKLYYDNKDEGKRDVWIEQDSANMKRWGVLQLTESVNAKKPINFAEMAAKKLAFYNRVRRTLSIKDAFGDTRVRAGTMVYCRLNLGDMLLEKQLIVTHVTHNFTDSCHLMDLELRGDVVTG